MEFVHQEIPILPLNGTDTAHFPYQFYNGKGEANGTPFIENYQSKAFLISCYTHNHNQ